MIDFADELFANLLRLMKCLQFFNINKKYDVFKCVASDVNHQESWLLCTIIKKICIYLYVYINFLIIYLFFPLAFE